VEEGWWWKWGEECEARVVAAVVDVVAAAVH